MYSYETYNDVSVQWLIREGLVTHEVHTITRTCDQADVTNGVEGAELVERQALVHEVDGHEVNGAEATVDSADEFVDRCTEVLVLLDVLS